MTEVCQFLRKIEKFPRFIVEEMTENFASGSGVSACFEKLGYSSAQITQIELSETHGNLKETLSSLKKQAIATRKQREKIIKILSYPILLLVFLFGILLVLREFLLPQIVVNSGGERNLAFLLIEKLPAFFLGFGGFLVLLSGSIYLFLKKKSAVFRVSFWCKLPLIRKFYKLYLTSVLAREWGHLFLQGHEMKTIVTIMENLQTNGFLREVGIEMGEFAERGISFDEQVEKWNFVESTFSVMILSGDVKNKLGEELLFYSNLCFDELTTSIEKRMNLVQPVVFLFVALMILGIYAAILLPIYNNMEGII